MSTFQRIDYNGSDQLQLPVGTASEHGSMSIEGLLSIIPNPFSSDLLELALLKKKDNSTKTMNSRGEDVVIISCRLSPRFQDADESLSRRMRYPGDPKYSDAYSLLKRHYL